MQQSKLSYRIFGTLRYIEKHRVFVEDLPQFNQLTIWACFYNKFISREAPNKEGKRHLVLTQRGYDALRTYTEADYAHRHQDGIKVSPSEEITERVSQMIAKARVIQMRRSA